MKTYIYQFYSFVFILLLLSCSKESNTTTEIETGSITGEVNLFSSRGGFAPDENMQVTIEGSDLLLTVFTDSIGEYTFEDIPYGRYDLRFEKEGFGTFKRGDIIHQNEETIIELPENLSRESTTGITQLTLSETETGITISLVTSPPANSFSERYARLFFNIGSETSSTIFGYFTPVLRVESTPYVQSFTFEEFESLGFISGAPIFIKAYGESLFSNEYIDPNNGDRIFPNINPNTTSNVSFIMP
ncbi:carboxypeptidase-like regulatory domain-containing protein [Dokdonia sp.]|uniref:carboxypeptidase-like regulatory domain-containing protein n=1 Tax=Dokdonia sp. TaxID=2024995 RepID=UPI0032641495